MTRPLGAILAGGLGLRMGRDKALVEVGGVPSIERVRAALADCVSEVLVVLRPGQESPLPGAGLVFDRHPERSVLAGLVRALEAAGPRRVVVAACDHPLLSADLVRLLLAREGEADARVPLVAGRLAPLVAVYEAPRALPPLARRLEEGRLSVTRALNELRLDIVPEDVLRRADPGLLSFLNLNTEEDLRRIRASEGL